MIILYLVCFAIAIYAIYKYIMRPYTLGQKYGLVGPPPLPLFGNIINYKLNGFHFCDKEYQKKYGHIYPVYMGRNPILVVSDEEVLRQILIKDSKSFMDRVTNIGTSRLMKKGLTQLKGKDWERVRQLVTPTFTHAKMKKISPMISACCEHMMYLFNSKKETEIDFLDVFASMTLDVISKTMFGMELDKSPSNVLVKYAKRSLNLSLNSSLFALMNIIPILVPVVGWLYPKGLYTSESIEYLEKTLTKAIIRRKNDSEKGHDFLSLLLRAHEEVKESHPTRYAKQEGKGLSDEEVMAQCILFLAVGHETTAILLTMCSYYLATNPEVQEEIYNELKEKVPADGVITNEILSNLHLVECCMLETLRICPLASRFQRVCTEDTTITTSEGKILNIKKGMTFTIPIYAIHHDERLWPDPEIFDIHRFNKEEKKQRSKLSFIPFGVGPRTCVGLRFALITAKLGIANLLMKYRINACDKTMSKLKFKPSSITHPTKPVLLKIEDRENLLVN